MRFLELSDDGAAVPEGRAELCGGRVRNRKLGLGAMARAGIQGHHFSSELLRMKIDMRGKMVLLLVVFVENEHETQWIEDLGDLA